MCITPFIIFKTEKMHFRIMVAYVIAIMCRTHFKLNSIVEVTSDHFQSFVQWNKKKKQGQAILSDNICDALFSQKPSVSVKRIVVDWIRKDHLRSVIFRSIYGYKSKFYSWDTIDSPQYHIRTKLWKIYDITFNPRRIDIIQILKLLKKLKYPKTPKSKKNDPPFVYREWRTKSPYISEKLPSR